MKNILLATDLSEKADRALERALKIAKEQKAKLHIIHIAPAYTGPKHNKKWALDLQKGVEELIRLYLEDYKDSKDIKTEITVRQGEEVFSQILETAYTGKADLIVMGMHNKEKLRDLFVGTTLERVVRKGLKPVLMVKNKPAGPYKSVLAPIDFAPASRSALRIGMELAPKAAFNAIHIYNVPACYADYADPVLYMKTQEFTENSEKKAMDAFLKTEHTHFAKTHNGQNKNLSGELLEGPVYDTLRKKAKSLKADLMTIGGHSRFGLASKLGGTAADMLSNPPCDILVASEKVYK
ncbi:MAG: universal stress protein [Alphaproteobacteria bacterium]|nr:universal stress protein [Alphaproteobacteria bacterium]